MAHKMHTRKARFIFACLLVLFTASSPVVKGTYDSGSQIVRAPTTLKKTQLHFYFHDIISGNNPSSVLVAKPKGTVVEQGNINPFGTVYVFDDPITEGPSAKSKVIGNARGHYTSVSQGSDLTLLLNADFEFTSGRFNGSSISVFSRDPLVVLKEVAVVGGRGKFRMAQGFIILNAVFFNATLGDAILESKPKGTVVEQGNINPFGTVYVFDDPITEGPSAKSKVIGNARGHYTSVSQGSDLTLLLNADFEFTSGRFNGSSISVFSRDPLVVLKEVAVVGGRGKFRMAQGFIILNAVFFNATLGDAILECNATIFH
ncbi:disease resistance-responsive (dirigent-like protein) family protein [Artemisia annua]|uniref:Dirigent protein n=1 Tax=Artemisia annua TaxID=35608 RepID=A0A2U1Q5L4_ARTAN|nr:disease resistance-responsive (dirigent-like protein) family protein [Artemisia annua]